jgi:hypothetical protein
LKKRNKALFIFFLAAAALLVLAVYAGLRIRQVARLQQQADMLDAQEALSRPGGAGLELLKDSFPARTDLSSFVEVLYAIARNSGLENVEIATMNTTRSGRVKNAAGPGNDAPQLQATRLRITCEGDYRVLAEYFGRMNGLRRYNRIVSFEMRPGAKAIQANIVVEIISFEARDAS